MVAVFRLFASLSMIMLQQMGFGLAVAVLIDATVIRAVLVPSTMKMLGEVELVPAAVARVAAIALARRGAATNTTPTRATELTVHRGPTR